MKQRTWFCLIVLGALLLSVAMHLPAQAQGDVYYVTPTGSGANDCSSWSNACVLQDATPLAGPGDEIWLAEGVHIPTVYSDRTVSFGLYDGVAWYGGFAGTPGTEGDFGSRDPAAHPTVLSGNIFTLDDSDNAYHVVRATGVGAGAVLDGLTITGGYADGASPDYHGGGMYNDQASPTLTNVNFSANHASFGGGGMYNYRSSPTLTNVTFSGDTAGDRGGGMWNQESSPTLTDCEFSGNSADWGAGGMLNVGSSPLLTRTRFSANTVHHFGGAMVNSLYSSPTLLDCEFSGNSADEGGGGAMYNNNASPTLTNVAFLGNHTISSGGGIYNSDSCNPVLTNTTFSGNSAGENGGGMYTLFLWNTSSPVLTNSTFSGNSAGGNGGGIYNEGTELTLVDSVLWGNTASSGAQMANVGGASPVVRYSDIQGSGGSGAGWDSGLGTDGGGNIDADSRFVDADGPDDVYGTPDDDLRLCISSPAIDAGDNTAVPGGVSTDLAGNPRFVDVPTVDDTGAGTPPLVDMGAYEYQYEAPPPTIYVDADATGANDGTSWTDAFTDLQDALTWAVDGVEIWVAEGTYKPTLESSPDDPRTATFQLVSGVAMYGGFDPSEEQTDWEQRDWGVHLTILSGDIGTSGVNSDNSYHVITGNFVTEATILDGFRVTGGYAVDGLAYDDAFGGGLFVYGGDPTLQNLKFEDNTAQEWGGGLYINTSNATLTNVDFSMNSAAGGGGMCNNHSTALLTNVTFSTNTATASGGGMYIWNSAPTLTDCTFADNSAPNGGAMYNDGSSPELTNVTFSSNTATASGGAIHNTAGSQPILEGVTFRLNDAGMWGGGLFAENDSDLTLTDAVFELNSADWGGGLAADGSAPTLIRVSFAENSASHGGGMASLYSSHPVVMDSTFERNSANQGGAIYNAAAVTLNNSTITDNDATQIGGGVCNAIFVVPGSMWINSSSITGNSADQHGGGIYNSGAMTIDDSTISGNAANADGVGGDGYGGGIYNTSSYGLDVDDTVIGGNSAVAGGGIHNEDGDLTLTNTTISGNNAEGDGGGICDQSSSLGIKLFNVTLTGNAADADQDEVGNGGGLAYYQGTVHLENTIIAGNVDLSASTRYSDCMRMGVAGIPFTQYNLIGDETGCDGDFAGTGDQVGTATSPLDPRLGQLADNGGPTLTHALLWDSLARDAGDPEGCYQPQDPYSVDFDQRGVERPRDGGAGEPLRCDIGAFEAGLPNDAWNRAQILDLSSGSATVDEYVDQLGQSRWYRFQVLPGSRVTAEMFPPDANLDIALFGDIQAAYDEQLATADAGDLGESNLVQLNAEFAADAYSPFAYSPFAYSPFAYSPFAYSPFAYSPFAYSPFAYSPFAYSPFAYSPFAYSPFAYSPFAYSPFAYSPFAYSPFVYSPFAYSPFAYSPDPAYSSAQMQTLMAISAFDGTASELIEVNTWDNRGWFYLRVSGRNGAFDPTAPFTLEVTQDLGVCAGVDLISRAISPAVSNGDYQALFLTDWSRLDPTNLQAELQSFAAAVGGTVVNVDLDTYVHDANTVADATPQCPYAKNQVAWLIKDIVTAYRDAGNPLEYVVLVGGDDVIPYFRYPDRAEIGSEKDYKPPVLEGTSSYASLTLGYVLSQDAYGSSISLALNNSSLPVPDLAVGRLVETPADILNMLSAYDNHGGSLTPSSALVTGYDFLEDAALAIQSELEAGGVTADALITPDIISPQDREGDPPLDAPWPAEMLRDQLLGARHDLIFLAGHFTAQGALAADYETRLWASELLAPTVDLENALVYSAGCHSGYNVVNEHGVPYVTVEPDWTQAFAQAGATFIGGTGYQYGDTDFLEYSERLYLEFTQALRCGAQPVSVGQALVEAKRAYLAGTAQMRGIHEKALLEATLFGLPMFQVAGLSSVGCPVDPSSEVTSTEPYVSVPGKDPTPGEVLELRYADLPVTSSPSLETVPLRNVVEGEEDTYLDTTYFSGTNGTVTSPAEPVLPLERRNVSLPGYVLRGVGFRGGHYADLPGEIPLTGAASTETRTAHTPFQSDVLYPLQPWSVNYFDLLADPASGITWLDVTPAQFVSDADDDIWTGTWRRFDDMDFRLFYSNHTATLDEGAVPSLAAPPAILRVLATSGTGEVQFEVAVAGDLAAGIQEVWVTYTGIPCDDGGACWQSRDLTQSTNDSTLWEETLPLNGAPAAEIRYVVQAVNGVGLVSLVTNEGAYFQIDVDPADPAVPAGGGEAPAPPEATSVDFQSPPASGTYSGEAEFSAVLTSGSTALEGQRLTFALGAQQRSAVTDANGSATVTFPLHGAPGDYTVSATFAGSDGYQRSVETSLFTILKQATVLSFLQDPDTAQYSDDAYMTAKLTDLDDNALGEMALLFVITGEGQSYVVSEITDLTGQASPSRVPLPVGTYIIDAYFGQEVVVNGQTVDLTDPNYSGALVSGALVLGPEDATVVYTGETTVPEGSTTLNLAALVAQADDGAPGDITLATVQYEIYYPNGTQVMDPVTAPVFSDGTSQATVDVPDAGTYLIRPVVIGDCFTSNPSLPVGGLTIEPVLFEVNSPTAASAVWSDPGGLGVSKAIWDWGDGITCDTSEGGDCALTQPTGETLGTVEGNHTYEQAGVYEVRLTLVDGNQNVAQAVYRFVVVYDPGDGFVTGGGWIWSQAGWCQLDDLCATAEGKANFGFVSRYKKGADAPTGTTEFNFSAGGLNFHSESYEWLVVNQAGTNAQFKGAGTINGENAPSGELYKFMIWAQDEDPDRDAFRIKIWREEGDETENVVYDNGFNQPISGGSIVIHQGD